MSVIYTEADGNRALLHTRQVAVIGYGNLGRPMALNLRDSGVNVVVGIRNLDAYDVVAADGLRATTIASAVQNSHLILLLLPDEVMSQVYLSDISPHLKRHHSLIFASAYNVAFGFIEPPPFVDVGLIAPRTLGPAVRERYLNGQGFYSFVAVGQDASGQIWETILALAHALGTLKAGAIEITMEQEAELDLFTQQAILPAVHHILTTAAHLLLEKGYPPEASILDLYISGELNDYLHRAAESGLMPAIRQASLTGQYGLFSRLERFKDLKLERLMEITLEQIRDGGFAREWAREYTDGYPRLRKLLKQQERDDLWELEQQTIDLLRQL